MTRNLKERITLENILEYICPHTRKHNIVEQLFIEHFHCFMLLNPRAFKLFVFSLLFLLLRLCLHSLYYDMGNKKNPGKM